ncbi:hypothetical protein GLYMA_02G210966v4 [Glycine max]|nr:hypothetical protein GLYMA_02G210966v4 [Glycine max]KAH1061408.1 hypothetical protein GYH30_004747 [Glycine max]
MQRLNMLLFLCKLCPSPLQVPDPHSTFPRSHATKCRVWLC